MPPWVGSGCRQTRVATGSRSAGRASSPTSASPSAVCRVSGSRRAGRTELARIGGMPPFSPTRLARPPAAVVPVAPLVEAGGGRAEGRGCHGPRDGVRRRRPDHLVAAGTAVRLRGGGSGHLPYDVLLAGVP